MKILDKNDFFVLGKYKNRRLSSVAEDDPSYLRFWIEDMGDSLSSEDRLKLCRFIPPELSDRASHLPAGYYRSTNGYQD